MLGYGAWRPDVGGPGSGFAQVAEGVIPQAAASGLGYGPFPQLVAGNGAAALNADPKGVVSIQNPDGTWAVYAATDSAIQQLQSDLTWLDIETGRNVPDADDVSFALMGTKLLNTDTADGYKAYDIVAGGTNNAVSGAPAARFTFVIKNVAFALATAAAPRKWANCDIGDYSRWVGGIANGGTLEDGGGLIGGADLRNGFGVMFQESAIRGITFGAGVSTFAISKVSDGIGCAAARTIAAFDGKVAWWSEAGCWMMAAGGEPVAVGAEKINRWAEANIGRQNFSSMQGAVDPLRKLFLWRADSARIIALNYLNGEFTVLPVSTAALARIATPAISIDNLTGTIDALDGTIDGLSGSASPQLGGLNLSRKFAQFTGSNMAATLESTAINNPVTGLVNWATPIDDCAGGTLQVGVSARLDADLDWKTAQAKVADGSTPQRARGHNIAFRRNIPAGEDWTYVNGVDHLRQASGGKR